MTLPTFLLCGAQKAGTTALYFALRAHPDVCMSRPKETEFFNWRYRRGWEWFSSHFDHYGGETAIGEASTRTMPTPEAPSRIAKRMSSANLIFILRNPIERAHSAFWYYLTQGILCPSEDFSQFIRNEGHPLRHEIIQYGFYGRHLNRFLTHFPRSQILLLRYRDLRERPDEQVRRVCQFIGVKELNTTPSTENITKYPTSRRLYALAHRLWKPVDQLFSRCMPSVLDNARQYGRRLLLGADRPSLASADRRYLERIYVSTAESIKADFGLDVTHWIDSAS
ncbi:sulfotransferase domain-containing protein [Salinibacter ruber]|uniref:sulfotransferase domain-containing protein n=1 Tax=Salinibacter ruber TaxID=146919 RepID=UPI003C6E61F8